METHHMEDLRDVIEARADAVIQTGEKFWPTRASTAWVKEKPWTLMR